MDPSTSDLSDDTPHAARLGYVAILVAASGWALIGVFTRRLGADGMAASELATWRALLGGACFALQVAVARRADAPGGPSVPASRGVGVAARLAAFCLIGVVVFFASLPLAIEAGGITLAYVLLYTAPAWVALGARMFLGHRLAAIDVALVGATLLGAAAISAAGGKHITIGVASVGWGLASGITYASYYLLGRRLFAELGAARTYAIVLPAGGAILALLVRPAWPNVSQWWLLAGLTVISTWLPYQCLAVGLARVPPSRAVVVATVEPVLAATLGAVFYGERPGPLGIVGGVTVLVAATLSSLRR